MDSQDNNNDNSLNNSYSEAAKTAEHLHAKFEVISLSVQKPVVRKRSHDGLVRPLYRSRNTSPFTRGDTFSPSNNKTLEQVRAEQQAASEQSSFEAMDTDTPTKSDFGAGIPEMPAHMPTATPHREGESTGWKGKETETKEEAGKIGSSETPVWKPTISYYNTEPLKVRQQVSAVGAKTETIENMPLSGKSVQGPAPVNTPKGVQEALDLNRRGKPVSWVWNSELPRAREVSEEEMAGVHPAPERDAEFARSWTRPAMPGQHGVNDAMQLDRPTRPRNAGLKGSRHA